MRCFTNFSVKLDLIEPKGRADLGCHASTCSNPTKYKRGEQEIKSGNVPDSFKETPNRLPQRGLDAQWVKKNDVGYYGSKNCVNIVWSMDSFADMMLRWQIFMTFKCYRPWLIPRMSKIFFFGNSAFVGKLFKEFLSAAGFESFSHEKG